MKVAIVGAGVAGLSAAYDLAGAGHAVTVFEAAPVTGGLAAGFKAEGWEWHLEHFYHHWFESDREVLDLIREIGESDKVFFPRPTTSIYVDGKIYPFDSPLRMLLFPRLPILPKLRFGLTGLYLRLTTNWRALERETAHNWLRHTMGETAYKVLWEPLLIGKFGDYYQEVNMAWFWARIHKRSYRLGYFQGGFQAFVDALTQRVEERGVTILLNTSTNSITSRPDQTFAVQYSSTAVPGAAPEPAEPETFDRVLLTVSPQLLTRLVPDLPETYLASIKKLKSMGAVVLILALKHSLTDQHYWINLPKDQGFPFLGLVEHTNFIDRKHYGNDHIVYCGDYLHPDHEYFKLSREELLERFLPALARFNPDFEPGWVTHSWLFRARYAQPIPPLNHSANIPPLQTPVPGLYWASMSQVYPWDRGTNYAVEIGRKAARLIMDEGE